MIVTIERSVDAQNFIVLVYVSATEGFQMK